MITIILNNQTIPVGDVKKFPRTDEKIQFNGATLFASKMDIVLDNSDPSKYDDRVAASLFYGMNWYNKEALIYDGADIIWKGRIKNITLNEKTAEVTISTNNLFRDMADMPCVYSSNSDISWAQIILNILYLPEYMNLSPSDLLLSGFYNAIAIQNANSAYGRINYTRKDDKKVLAVLNEICRITQCHMYSVDSKIGFYQWQQWDGATGIPIFSRKVIAGSYSHTFIEDQIYNDFSIAYVDGAAVSYEEDSDEISVTNFGRKPFSAPDKDVRSTDPDNFKLIFRSQTGAAWAASIGLQRLKYIRKICDLEILDDFAFIKLNNQIDFNFDTFQNEPVRIFERAHNRDQRRIKLRSEFLNTPNIVYSRDITPPLPVDLWDVTKIASGTVLVRWSQSFEADHSGYKLYFATSEGDWETESCSEGVSPIDIKSPPIDILGYCWHVLQGLSNTNYFFKVKSYDTSSNLSGDSDILSLDLANPANDLAEENLYRCDGDKYAKIYPTPGNVHDGEVPEGYILYDGIYYDAETFSPLYALYSSGMMLRVNTSSTLTIKSDNISRVDSMKFQWRSYSAGNFSAWSSLVTLDGSDLVIDVGGLILIQIRALFNPLILYEVPETLADYFYIENIF